MGIWPVLGRHGAPLVPCGQVAAALGARVIKALPRVTVIVVSLGAADAVFRDG